MNSIKRRLIAVGGAVTVVLSLVGAGLANAADEPTSQEYTGVLRNGIITNVAIGDTPAGQWKGGGTVIHWSQTGPQGPQGIQGEQGIQGPQGEKGEPGTAAPQTLVQAAFIRQDTIGDTASVTLPAGAYNGLMTGVMFPTSAGNYGQAYLLMNGSPRPPSEVHVTHPGTWSREHGAVQFQFKLFEPTEVALHVQSNAPDGTFHAQVTINRVTTALG